MRRNILLLALAALMIVGLSSCNDQEKGDADIYLTTTVTQEGMQLYVDVGGGSVPSLIEIIFSSHPKNPNASLSSLQDVTLTRMTVNWVRRDGGTVTPDPYTLSIYHVVPANGDTTIDNIPLMYPDQLTLPPFDQLFPWNGGIDRETQKTYINCDAEITFYGRTNGGRDVTAEHTVSFFSFYFGAAR